MSDPHPPGDVVRLAEVSSPQQAHMLRQVLEAEGIRCQVTGDYLDAGLGSLDNIKAEVLVRAADLDRARAALEAHQQQPETEEEGEAEE